MDIQRSNINKEKELENLSSTTILKIFIAISVYVVIVFMIKTIDENFVSKDSVKYVDRWVHNLDGTWSYSVNGKNVYNWYKIDGKMYHFDWKGIMETDRAIDSYYIGDDGATVINQWKKTSGNWRYYGNDGKYYRDKFLLYNNEWYYFDKSGYMVENKWINYKGKKYYFGSNGVMLKNQYIKLGKDGVGYLNEDGSLLTNGRIDKYIADLDGYLTLAP